MCLTLVPVSVFQILPHAKSYDMDSKQLEILSS